MPESMGLCRERFVFSVLLEMRPLLLKKIAGFGTWTWTLGGRPKAHDKILLVFYHKFLVGVPSFNGFCGNCAANFRKIRSISATGPSHYTARAGAPVR